MDADAGMPSQLLLQNVVHETDPIRSGDKESEEPLSGSNRALTASKAAMLAQGEQKGSESVPLSPSLLLATKVACDKMM